MRGSESNSPVAARRARWWRAIAISLLVGSAVSIGHALAPERPFWPIVHAALPASVFLLSAWGAGARRLTFELVGRGVIVIAAVAVGFSLVNGAAGLPMAARVGANYLIPFVVSWTGGTAR